MNRAQRRAAGYKSAFQPDTGGMHIDDVAKAMLAKLKAEGEIAADIEIDWTRCHHDGQRFTVALTKGEPIVFEVMPGGLQ